MACLCNNATIDSIVIDSGIIFERGEIHGCCQ